MVTRRNKLIAGLVLAVVAGPGVAEAKKPPRPPPPPSVSFSRTDYATGGSPKQVAIADLNGDGYNDLATADTADNGIAVLLNDKQGGFPSHTNIATGAGPYGVAAGDVNGDGKSDLVVADSGSNLVSVLLGNGDGTFAAKQDFAITDEATTYGPRNAVIADFNGDGRMDIATENQNDDSVSVLVNNGTSPLSFSIADFPTGTVPYGLVVADFDGDGHLDLATANSYCRDSSGQPSSTIACGTVSNSVTVLHNNGAGAFATSSSYATATNPRSLVTANFNGDTIAGSTTTPAPDLATANFNVNSVSVLLNDRHGAFPTHFEFDASVNPRSAAAADFNGSGGAGDGKVDLAIANQNSNTLDVRLGDGTGHFGGGSSLGTGDGPFWVSAGDLNHDGHADVVTANFRANTISVFRNTTP